MTTILGISAYYHDSAACIVIDGKIIAAAQEERYTRKKHDPRFPSNAIQYCLAEADTTIQAIDAIVFYDKPLLKFERLLETFLANAPKGFVAFARAMPIWLKEKLYLKSVLRRELRALVNQSLPADKQLDKKQIKLPQLLFTEHHQSHAASAFFPSPFEDAAVICMDGVGEWATSSVWHGNTAQLTALQEIHFPHSLGLLYSAFTYYCGFRVNAGEYKLMGLAPYGEPKYVETILKHLIDLKEDGSFRLNMGYFDYPVGSVMTNKRFEQLFGLPKLAADEVPSKHYCDMARSIQVVTEQVVVKIAKYAKALTGSDNLCLAGGVALNCVANEKIIKQAGFKSVWIQPASGDAGGALGAALCAWFEYFENPRTPATSDSMSGALLGNTYSDKDIEVVINTKQIPAEHQTDKQLFEQVCGWLQNDNVVGWFQGRMEFGPRALGNRSIIGDARSTRMQRQMNVKIKQRESFRPFAPIVLAEKAAEYFDLDCLSPYMLVTAPLNKQHRLEIEESSANGLERVNQVRSHLPAITHIDYSARLQTVDKETNPRLHKLLSTFNDDTGTPVLINTSFNVRGEPPVCSPEDAIRCFLATDMDYLVMGNWVLDKRNQRDSDIKTARAVTFEKD